jgi:hypothetical protein
VTIQRVHLTSTFTSRGPPDRREHLVDGLLVEPHVRCSSHSVATRTRPGVVSETDGGKEAKADMVTATEVWGALSQVDRRDGLHLVRCLDIEVRRQVLVPCLQAAIFHELLDVFLLAGPITATVSIAVPVAVSVPLSAVASSSDRISKMQR